MRGKNAFKNLKQSSGNLKNEIFKSESLTPASIGIDVRKRLFQVTPLPAFIFKNVGSDIILIDYSKSAIEIINNISSNLLNKSAKDIFADLPEITFDILKCFSEKSSLIREIIYKQNDKELYKYFKFIYTFVDPDLLLIHAEDIKKRKIAESALHENKERLELAILTTESGLWDWKIQTGEIIFNDRWANMLGYSPNELDNDIVTWENLLHPDDKPRVLKCLNSHIDGKAPNYMDEHRLLTKNGGWIWVLDTGKIVAWDKNGNPLRAIGYKIDITNRKQMEKEIMLLNLELEKRVEERTRELKKKELSLLKSRQELKNKSLHLEEVNNALKILIKKSDENKKEIEENLVANIKELVVPYLEKIDSKGLSDVQKTYLDIIRSNLSEIVSPFSRKLTSKHLNLTPAEIKLADLIKHGKSTKEIADLLCLSTKTIETQRRNIRKKLAINNKKVNLRTYLQSIQ